MAEPVIDETDRVFSDEWKVWIWTNVGRGCDKDEIFKILREKGFAHEDIARELGHRPAIDIDQAPSLLEGNHAVVDTRQFAHAVQVDSDQVEMFHIGGFLSAAECDHLVEIIKGKLEPSRVTRKGSVRDPEFRTSQTSHEGLLEDPVGAEIDIRICRYMGINPTYTEPIQGQYYRPGEVFKAHCDWFDGESEGFRFGGYENNQRTWTFMIYLNDRDSGGETEFVDLGRKFLPRRGDAVFWNNLRRNGEGNTDTLHQSLPFDSGFKCVITKWFRSKGEGEPSTRSPHEMTRAFHPVGFEKVSIPDDLFQRLREFLAQHRAGQVAEDGSDDYLSNADRQATHMVELDPVLKEAVAQALKPLLNQWSGISLRLSAVYGIRIYARGTRLRMHRDRKGHIVSAILNLDQSVDEPWPLTIEDHFFRTHNVLMAPGEMLFYESYRLNHGRPTPLEGEHYTNLFAHFRPEDSSED